MVRYAVILILSVLIYWIPFHIGEYLLRFILALMVVLLIGDSFRLILKLENKSFRNSLLLTILNSIALFHLALIFSYLMFESTTTLIIGVVAGVLLYYFVNNRNRQLL